MPNPDPPYRVENLKLIREADLNYSIITIYGGDHADGNYRKVSKRKRNIK
ncbi:hypothetical protein D1BOALGB6SA_4143 [Olavius sp. associated proteobacterium Delta 1]|nr:hypothetical protein D1BOALGB6SA_4143 [Olavius sp. associated proteobacterium Delta 1]